MYTWYDIFHLIFNEIVIMIFLDYSYQILHLLYPIILRVIARMTLLYIKALLCMQTWQDVIEFSWHSSPMTILSELKFNAKSCYENARAYNGNSAQMDINYLIVLQMSDKGKRCLQQI